MTENPNQNPPTLGSSNEGETLPNPSVPSKVEVEPTARQISKTRWVMAQFFNPSSTKYLTLDELHNKLDPNKKDATDSTDEQVAEEVLNRANLLSHPRIEDLRSWVIEGLASVDDPMKFCNPLYKAPEPTPVPTLILDPTSGPDGTYVGFSGKNYDPGSTLRIAFLGENLSVEVDRSSGSFGTSEVVPAKVDSGEYDVVAYYRGKDTPLATTKFTVTESSKPAIKLNPTSGATSTEVAVNGSNLKANANYNIDAFGSNTPTSTDGAGKFEAKVTVPGVPAGPYTFTLKDSSAQEVTTANFEVERLSWL